MLRDTVMSDSAGSKKRGAGGAKGTKRAMLKRAEQRERARAALPALPDPSGGVGEWYAVENFNELLRRVQELEDNSLSHCTEHRFARIHIKKKQFRFMDDIDSMYVAQRLVPVVRALRIDDLHPEYWFAQDGFHENGYYCCMDADHGRGQHFFCPLNLFGSSLVRLELRASERVAESFGEVEPVPLDVASLHLETLTSLRYLKMSNFEFNEKSIAALGECKSLHGVVFECCAWHADNRRDANDKLSEALANLKELMTFSLFGSPQYCTSSEEPQPRPFTFQQQSFLTMLLPKGDLRVLPSLPPRVQEIDLYGCILLQDLSALSALCVTLKRIRLAFCPFVNNAAVPILATCKELEQINLDGTAVSVVEPLRELPKLRFLSLRFAAVPDDPLKGAKASEWDCYIDWKPQQEETK